MYLFHVISESSELALLNFRINSFREIKITYSLFESETEL